jgi:D-glycero-D-manno-heptose 1,7-bisphosphate phosphatase
MLLFLLAELLDRSFTMSTIFLDRDGVINENRSDYVKHWSEFCFLPGSKEAMAMLTHAGHRIIVCTNQAGIARGNVSRETVEEIHRRMVAEIAEAGGTIEQVYYCPHGKDEKCFCRKPRPGMLLRARDELGLNMRDSLFIGDSISDINAALAAGVHPILVLTGLGREHLREYGHEVDGSFAIAMSLKHITEMILQGWIVEKSGISCY